MYITSVPNRENKPTILLRESYREGAKVKNRTLANLTHLPPHILDAVKCAADNKKLVTASDAFTIDKSLQHGHVDAVLKTMHKLGFEKLLGSRASRERSLVMSMVASRILHPKSKLETTRWWDTTTLPESLNIQGATEDDLYHAMDWLLERQPRIEKKLADRHLESGGLVLYDLSSTYMEGHTCPLAKRGYSRDKKTGKTQVNFGLLTDKEGRPVSIQVYEGNVADPQTVTDQVRTLRERFGIEHVILVGDRGMVTQTHVDKFTKAGDGSVDWISALKSGAIRKLKNEGVLQLDLFDERNLFELHSESFPNERLVACRNPELQKRRAHKRKALVDATKTSLEKIRITIANGRLKDKGKIGVRVGRVINQYKVAKHFILDIEESSFSYRIDQSSMDAEAALDGVYVIRTSVSQTNMSAEDAVRNYKRLTKVERAFRSMKTVDLKVRPVYHRLANRVRAHIFLCMLAYYIEWHMRKAWSSLLFSDEVDNWETRDPVATAKRSPAAIKKISRRRTADDLPIHSFQSLLSSLTAVVKNTCRRNLGAKEEPSFELTTRPDPLHVRALGLLEEINVP